IPVTIPNSEAYSAMQRNMLDCVHGSTAWLDALSLDEVVTTVVQLPMGSYLGGSLFNIRQAVWEELSDKDKKAIYASTAKGIARAVYGYMQKAHDAKETAEEKGISYIPATDEIKAKLQSFRENQIDRLINIASKRGVKD